MSVLYEPKGNAREFGELACSVYLKCTHACLYCYCPQVLHVPREDYFKKPEVRPGFLKRLSNDARKLAGDRRRVLLSFVGDVYQPAEEEYHLTRQAIATLHAHSLHVTILTKGGKRATQDFDLLGPGDQFAVTLTCVDDMTSKWWEPGAALPMERMESLVEAQSRGIETWVSLEPVLYPQATKQLILLTKDLVSHFKVGKLNYDPWAAKIDWAAFAQEITEFMNTLGVRFYVKKDLAQYLGKSEGFWSSHEK